MVYTTSNRLNSIVYFLHGLVRLKAVQLENTILELWLTPCERCQTYCFCSLLENEDPEAQVRLLPLVVTNTRFLSHMFVVDCDDFPFE